MKQPTTRRVALLLLMLMLCGVVLGQTLAATRDMRIYAPVVLKGGQSLPTSTATATSTLLPAETPTATGTATSTSTPSLTPTATSTVSPTATPTPTSTPTPGPSLALTGTVSLRPLQRLDEPPLAYVVVLDVSGSMNWNFNGQAIINGQVRQCGLGPDPSLNALIDQDFAACNTAGGSYWAPVEERRIYVAKQSLMRFIDLLGPNDRMQIIAFSGQGVNTVGSAQLGDATGKAALKQAVLDAGKTAGDPYVTRGGTPTATALYQTGQLITSGSWPLQAPNGLDYKNIVVLMTDGVPNFYRDTSNGNYTGTNTLVGWENRAQDQYPQCAVNYSMRIECQIGYADTTKGLIARPVTAMINEGQQLHTIADVHVIGLAGAPAAAGLPAVASVDVYPWYAEVPQGQGLDQVFSDIYISRASLETGALVDQIDAAHAPDPATLPEVSATTFGVVTLSAPGVITRTAAIQTDPATGKLAYRFDGLAPGSYTLTAWIGYKGDDGVTLRYGKMSGFGPTQTVDLSSLVPPATARRNLVLER
ncbi:MAG: hypothetical protein OHK0022_02210 [Roseiflexaceae bacterium]